jgi:tRNA-2-methylthio-N6-dimethylallyladenosine synthase
VLKRMFRGYTKASYLELAEKGRELVPGLSLASDFIVGFPGETEEDFEETIDLMERIRFDQSFVFKYSVRPGTRSSEWEDDVPDAVKKVRNNRLLKIQSRHSLMTNQGRIGRNFEVLVEGPSPKKPERLTGRTRGNQIAVFHGDPDLAGQTTQIRVHRVTPLTLIGEVLSVNG